MSGIFNYAFLYLLKQLLENNTSPLVCAGLFSVGQLFLGLVFGVLMGATSLIPVLITTILSFIIAFITFWLMSRFDGFINWIILILGGFIMIYLL